MLFNTIVTFAPYSGDSSVSGASDQKARCNTDMGLVPGVKNDFFLPELTFSADSLKMFKMTENGIYAV